MENKKFENELDDEELNEINGGAYPKGPSPSYVYSMPRNNPELESSDNDMFRKEN